MPAGVMPDPRAMTIITPLASGMTIMIHSKQPQAVIGFSMIEYMETFSTDWCECWCTKSIGPVK